MPPRRKSAAQSAQRVTVLEAITAPLGFFVLALLIVEAFLATVLVGTNLEPKDKLSGMWAGIGLFVFVTLIVAVLVWYKPSHLTFDKHAHLIDRGRVPYGTDQERVPPEELFESGSKEEAPK